MRLLIVNQIVDDLQIFKFNVAIAIFTPKIPHDQVLRVRLLLGDAWVWIEEAGGVLWVRRGHMGLWLAKGALLGRVEGENALTALLGFEFRYICALLNIVRSRLLWAGCLTTIQMCLASDIVSLIERHLWRHARLSRYYLKHLVGPGGLIDTHLTSSTDPRTVTHHGWWTDLAESIGSCLTAGCLCVLCNGATRFEV